MAMDVSTDILTPFPHPVSFESASAPRAVLATRTSPAVSDHEDVQTVFQFAWDPRIEVSLCGDAVRFGGNPAQELAEAKYVGVDGEGLAFQTEHEDARRRLWANALVGN